MPQQPQQPQHRAPVVPAQRAEEPWWQDASLPVIPSMRASRDRVSPSVSRPGGPTPDGLVAVPRQRGGGEAPSVDRAPGAVPRQRGASGTPSVGRARSTPATFVPGQRRGSARPTPAGAGPGWTTAPGTPGLRPRIDSSQGIPRAAARHAAAHPTNDAPAHRAEAGRSHHAAAHAPHPDERDVPATGLAAVLDIVGRVGSAVTLAAVLALAVAVGVAVDGQPASDSAPLTVTFGP